MDGVIKGVDDRAAGIGYTQAPKKRGVEPEREAAIAAGLPFQRNLQRDTRPPLQERPAGPPCPRRRLAPRGRDAGPGAIARNTRITVLHRHPLTVSDGFDAEHHAIRGKVL
jgi:hypothetical protein